MATLVGPMERLIRYIHNLAAVLLAIASVLVFYQVVTRFLLGDSAVWSEVLARAVIVWTVFLVMAPAFRLGRMIPIEAVRNMCPPKVQLWIIRLVTLCILTVLGVLIWYGAKVTQHVVHQNVAMIDVSVAWFYVSMPIGATLAIVGVLLAHRDAERGHIGHLDEDIDEETIE